MMAGKCKQQCHGNASAQIADRQGLPTCLCLSDNAGTLQLHDKSNVAVQPEIAHLYHDLHAIC